MLMEKRSIPVCIILSIVTCGIYSWYWTYKLLDEFYKANNVVSSAGMDVLLSIVTCGIYYIYLQYKFGKLESTAHATYGLPPKDDSILYLILGIFSLSIVNQAIIQNNNNNMLADVVNAAYIKYHAGGGHGQQ